MAKHQRAERSGRTARVRRVDTLRQFCAWLRRHDPHTWRRLRRAVLAEDRHL